MTRYNINSKRLWEVKNAYIHRRTMGEKNHRDTDKDLRNKLK